VKPTLRTKLESLTGRLGELERLLAAEDATRNLSTFRDLSREHAEVSGVVNLFRGYQQVERDAAEAREMGADPSM